jgi:hypothetical protein
MFGACVTIVFLGNGRFNIRVKNRFGKKNHYPTFNPPTRFAAVRNAVPFKAPHGPKAIST